MSNVEIRLLGPVEFWSDLRKIPAGSPKQRCLLAVLAYTPGYPVSLDGLVERLWGQDPPKGAYHSLYTYIARLRRPLYDASGGDAVIVRTAASYTLQIDPECVDLHQARAEVQQAVAAVAAGQDEMAVRRYRRALQRWRGEPLAGLRGAWTERVRVGFRQERLAALTECFAAQLRLGRHTQVVGEISAAFSDHPLDEALASQLMLSLYRSRRPADALAVFHQTKAELASQLGLDPGPGLVQLYRSILRNDSSLDLPAAQPSGSSSEI